MDRKLKLSEWMSRWGVDCNDPQFLELVSYAADMEVELAEYHARWDSRERVIEDMRADNARLRDRLWRVEREGDHEELFEYMGKAEAWREAYGVLCASLRIEAMTPERLAELKEEMGDG